MKVILNYLTFQKRIYMLDYKYEVSIHLKLW
jgi:hypothetical protein